MTNGVDNLRRSGQNGDLVTGEQTMYQTFKRSTNLINVLRKTVWHGLGFHVQPIMFVRRLRKAHSVRLLAHSFTVRDDRVRDLQWDARVVLLEVLQTDLEMQLTSSSNNVLTRLLNRTLDKTSTTSVSIICMLCHTINQLPYDNDHYHHHFLAERTTSLRQYM